MEIKNRIKKDIRKGTKIIVLEEDQSWEQEEKKGGKKKQLLGVVSMETGLLTEFCHCKTSDVKTFESENKIKQTNR